jgi:nucleotidyltransferase substrate binding protein (TIGR01987 family)
MIDLSPLRRALVQLEAGLAEANAHPGHALMRDGVIQRFDYSYELCHKMLRRHLAETEPSPGEVEAMPFPDLIRTGWERGLLAHSWDRWKEYRAFRGTTSHTYGHDKAASVFAAIPDFLEEARTLLLRLERDRTTP